MSKIKPENWVLDVVLNHQDSLENMAKFDDGSNQLLAKTAFEYAKEVQE
ncbi:hypothetical protein [Methanococcoides sp. AM1]|nr:hypothetical protein [Methanococcoides sp. AM1]